MSKNLKGAYSKAIGRADDVYAHAIDLLTDDLYRNVVLPYCVKNGLTFAAGMGTWAFYPHG